MSAPAGAKPPTVSLQSVKNFVAEVQKKLVVSALPDVYVKLRKRTQIYALEVVVGTDIQVFENEKDKAQVHLNPLAHYKPNLHFECHDRLLGGDIGLSTKNNEISYTKLYEVQGLELGVSALYNYAERVPYAGFVLHSTSGVSSAAKSNAFSINHSMDLDFMPVDTKLQFQGEVALPGTKFDTKTGTVGLTGPVDVKFHNLIATFSV